MATPTTTAPAPAGTAPTAPAAPHARKHGLLDLLAVAVAVGYAIAVFVLCLFGESFNPNKYNEIQDLWGVTTTFFTLIQVASVVILAESYKHSVLSGIELLSSLATIVIVAIVGVCLLAGFATPNRWTWLIWINALGAGIIDALLLWHAHWLTKQH